jgi:hypothetical protein
VRKYSHNKIYVKLNTMRVNLKLKSNGRTNEVVCVCVCVCVCVYAVEAKLYKLIVYILNSEKKFISQVH